MSAYADWDDECCHCGIGIGLDEDWPDHDGHACVACADPDYILEYMRGEDPELIQDMVDTLLELKAGLEVKP